MEFKIEDGIPVANTAYNSSRYPFGELQVGQSFAIPRAIFPGAQNAGYSWVRRHPGIKLKFRLDGKGKDGRCWRIA